MIIKKMSLHNFRQYKGTQELIFSKDKERNITVVLGKNTSGKTTLLQAFYLCLYGAVNFSKNKAIDFLNIEVASELNHNQKAKVKVEIELLHRNKEYIISREYEYRKNYEKLEVLEPEFKIFCKGIDGITRPIDGYSKKEEEIETILPKKLAPYFLFDAERIQNIADNEKEGKSDIAEAVKSILGLEVLEKIRNHFSKSASVNSVVGRFNKSLNIETDEKTKAILNRIEGISNEIEKLTTDIETAESNQEHFAIKEEKFEKQLEELGDIKVLQEKRRGIQIQVNEKTNILQEKERELLKYFVNNAFGFFLKPLFEKAKQKIKEAEKNSSIIGEGIPEMKAKAIDYIIKRGKCICGNEIIVGNECYKNIKKEQELLPPKFLGGMIREFNKDGKNYSEKSNELLFDYEEIYKSIRKLETEIGEKKDEIIRIDKIIEGKEDVREIEINRRKAREEKDKYMRIIYINKGKIEKLNEERAENEKLISEMEFTSLRNKKIQKCIYYAEKLREIFEEAYMGREIKVREKLNEKVNEYFCKMYHGKRRILINERYGYELTTNDDENYYSAESSMGLKVVTSFAFITGIIDLAKQKISNGLGTDEESEPYPLIMDAPFSMTDDEHVKNISQAIPEVAEQIVFFIMHKDWHYTKKILEHRIDKVYELDKIRETNTILKEETAND